MNAARRYRLAFLALGWLVALVLALQLGLDAVLRAGYGRLTAVLAGLGERLSEREGRAWERMHAHPRRQELAPLAPLLGSVEQLRRPPRVLFGAYDGGLPDSFAGLDGLETALGHRFAIVSFYAAWGDRPDEQFPRRVVETIAAMGSVPFVTWEPWVTDFDDALRPNLPQRAEREYASLAAIARGDYDFYVVPWARAAAAFGRPFFLRFAHEMNDPYRYPWGPQNGNRPEDFIAAWRHVHAVFEKMGARNVLWVWSPHVSMPWFEYYDPGGEVVDWIGVGVLNYGTTASWSRWWTADQILHNAYPALAKLHRPIVVAEFGTVDAGGDPTQWYHDAFRDFAGKYPAVRAVVLFNQPHDVTVSAQPLDWSVLKLGAARVEVERALRASAPGPGDGGGVPDGR